VIGGRSGSGQIEHDLGSVQRMIEGINISPNANSVLLTSGRRLTYGDFLLLLDHAHIVRCPPKRTQVSSLKVRESAINPDNDYGVFCVDSAGLDI